MVINKPGSAVRHQQHPDMVGIAGSLFDRSTSLLSPQKIPPPPLLNSSAPQINSPLLLILPFTFCSRELFRDEISSRIISVQNNPRGLYIKTRYKLWGYFSQKQDCVRLILLGGSEVNLKNAVQ